MYRRAIVFVLCAACGGSDAGWETLIGHWEMTVVDTGGRCGGSSSWFDVNADRTVATKDFCGPLTSQFVGEPQASDAAEPSVRFSTHLEIGGPEAGQVDCGVRMWLLDGRGSGRVTTSIGGNCEATAVLTP